MSNSNSQDLTRISVFYDGNYFLHVSNYYNYHHEKRSRISISGLHEFIKNQVAYEESTDARFCHIVDAHYFRGRLNAKEARLAGELMYNERVFEDILMSEGVVTHYLPLKTNMGVKSEKGIDVWLALEAFELAYYKRFNVLVLVACDGDYVPLIRKLNTLGTRVMLLSWDFEYLDHNDEKKTTRTSQDLLEEVTYPIAMHEIIENRVKKNEPIINNLFVQTTSFKEYKNTSSIQTPFLESTILHLKNGFGFIKWPNNNLYFHHTNLLETDFNDLKSGDPIRFKIGKNAKGEDVAIEVSLKT